MSRLKGGTVINLDAGSDIFLCYFSWLRSGVCVSAYVYILFVKFFLQTHGHEDKEKESLKIQQQQQQQQLLLLQRKSTVISFLYEGIYVIFIEMK